MAYNNFTSSSCGMHSRLAETGSRCVEVISRLAISCIFLLIMGKHNYMGEDGGISLGRKSYAISAQLSLARSASRLQAIADLRRGAECVC